MVNNYGIYYVSGRAKIAQIGRICHIDHIFSI